MKHKSLQERENTLALPPGDITFLLSAGKWSNRYFVRYEITFLRKIYDNGKIPAF